MLFFYYIKYVGWLFLFYKHDDQKIYIVHYKQRRVLRFWARTNKRRKGYEKSFVMKVSYLERKHFSD